MPKLHAQNMQKYVLGIHLQVVLREEDVSTGGTPLLVKRREDSPVDVGVQKHGCVLRQLGQMHHLGFQLRSLRFVHPHVRQSARGNMWGDDMWSAGLMVKEWRRGGREANDTNGQRGPFRTLSTFLQVT